MYYDSDEKRLEHQKNKDKFKLEKCKELNIRLLEFSYENIKHKKDTDVIDYIIKFFKEDTFTQEKIYYLKNLNISTTISSNTKKINTYKIKVNDILIRRNSTLENENININTIRVKFNVKCQFDHIFETNLETLLDKRNKWCPKCKNVKFRKLKINEINLKKESDYIIIDMDKFGVCLIKCMKCFNEINNINVLNIPIQCNKQHDADVISIEYFQPIKHSRLNKFLKDNDNFTQASDYINAKTKIQLKCKNNHTLWIIPDYINKVHCSTCLTINLKK
jgi:Zn finger protein HypA/HybF involved in hydrogenase expression